ncbi:hypothetical protein LCGC14_1345730 [marine sediment metagenome]|uniref:Uncharacterized protein n=1 Tax=marine sediment metagenome TaxID=412755 RepID=A0A0F9KYG7_9ZZZZ
MAKQKPFTDPTDKAIGEVLIDFGIGNIFDTEAVERIRGIFARKGRLEAEGDLRRE